MTDFFCAACCSLFDLFLMNFNWSFSETDPSLGSIRQHKQRQQRPHGKPIKNATKIKTNAENERRMSTASPYLPPFHSYVYYASWNKFEAKSLTIRQTHLLISSCLSSSSVSWRSVVLIMPTRPHQNLWVSHLSGIVLTVKTAQIQQ